MRALPLLVLSALALSAIGCADVASSSWERHNIPLPDSAGAGADASEEEPASGQGVRVHGAVSAEATRVEILALGEDGALTPAGSAPVTDGTFDAELAPGGSPTGIFIVKVKGIGDAVLGSAVLNGLPAFVKAFVIDATVDAATSFKAEILTTIAKKGVPGVQNFLNVIDAYVDAQLTNAIITDGALTTDVNAIVGATADAVIAAETAIEDSLQKAGIPLDLGALKSAQLAAVSGFTTMLTDAAGQRTTAAKNLVAALQAASANFAAPIDQAIFNAVVLGGAAFGATMMAQAPGQGFAASQAAFSLESAISSAKVADAFAGTPLADAIAKAVADFHAAVGAAASAGDLEAARDAFTNAILGTADPKNALAGLLPLVEDLVAALLTLDLDQIADALAKLDVAPIDLPAQLEALLDAADVAAVTDALRLVQKQVVQ